MYLMIELGGRGPNFLLSGAIPDCVDYIWFSFSFSFLFVLFIVKLFIFPEKVDWSSSRRLFFETRLCELHALYKNLLVRVDEKELCSANGIEEDYT